MQMSPFPLFTMSADEEDEEFDFCFEDVANLSSAAPVTKERAAAVDKCVSMDWNYILPHSLQQLPEIRAQLLVKRLGYLQAGNWQSKWPNMVEITDKLLLPLFWVLLLFPLGCR
jgi:hypothetical protein